MRRVTIPEAGPIGSRINLSKTCFEIERDPNTSWQGAHPHFHCYHHLDHRDDDDNGDDDDDDDDDDGHLVVGLASAPRIVPVLQTAKSTAVSRTLRSLLTFEGKTHFHFQSSTIILLNFSSILILKN